MFMTSRQKLTNSRRAANMRSAQGTGPCWPRPYFGKELHSGPFSSAFGGAPILRQANKASRNLCRSGGNRDRERATVRGGPGAHERVERIAPAADRYSRRAESDQPFDIRLANRAGYPPPVGGAVMRGKWRVSLPARRYAVPPGRKLRRTVGTSKLHAAASDCAREGNAGRTDRAGAKTGSHSRCPR